MAVLTAHKRILCIVWSLDVTSSQTHCVIMYPRLPSAPLHLPFTWLQRVVLEKCNHLSTFSPQVKNSISSWSTSFPEGASHFCHEYGTGRDIIFGSATVGESINIFRGALFWFKGSSLSILSWRLAVTFLSKNLRLCLCRPQPFYRCLSYN